VTVKYERIGTSWPNERERRDEVDERYRLRDIPFNVDHPLLFHVLSTLPEGQDGETELLDLMRRGVALLPRNKIAREPWGDTTARGKMFAADVEAGDDVYVFTTPCHPVAISDLDDKPALAFDARVVAARSKIAFRPTDMEPFYRRLTSLVSEESFYENEYGYDDDSPSDERDLAFAKYAASDVGEDLRSLAECSTQTDATKAGKLVLRYSHALWESGVEFPETLVPEQCELWGDSLIEPSVVEDIDKAWRLIFEPEVQNKFPWNLILADSRPEVLIRGILPLCEATFFRDAERRWLSVPKDVCDIGRESIRRNGARGL